MSARDFDGAMHSLARASRRRFAGLAPVDEWPTAIAADAWCFPPELISLHGTEAWESLDEPGRRRLAFFEAVNFFSINVHGEKRLVSEIARRLHGEEDAATSRYLAHFVEEEAKHMMYFAAFCERYADGVYADGTITVADEDDQALGAFLVFARIFVFEEVVDEFNRRIAADPAIAPVVREINRMHHAEEARHLAFGRRVLTRRCAIAHRDPETLARVRSHLRGYVAFVWQQLHNPEAYRDAGVERPIEAWRASLVSPSSAARRRLVEGSRLGVLRDLGLLEGAT